MHRRSLSFAALFLLPGFALAQGTGSTLTDDERIARTEGFYQRVLQTKTAEASYREDLEEFRQTFAEARRICRSDIRRANRDLKFPTQMRCLRSDVILYRDFALVQREILAATAGVTAEVRADVLGKLDAWADALDAILAGIDTGVYTSEADLHDAKSNLLSKYRSPLLHAFLRLRADRELSWSVFLRSRLEEAMAEEEERVGALDPSWEDAVTCLDQGEALYQSALAAKDSERRAALLAALTHMQSCTDQLRALKQAVLEEEQE